jgi:hypothetical protein
MKEINKDMKDFIIEMFSDASAKVGKRAFGRDTVGGDALRGVVPYGPEAGI